MKKTKALPLVLGWILIVASMTLYGYALWSAVGNVILFPQFAAAIGLGISPNGWLWLIVQMMIPLVVVSLAFVLGRKRSLLLRGLILLVGVAVVSVLTIDVMHSIPQSSYFG